MTSRCSSLFLFFRDCHICPEQSEGIFFAPQKMVPGPILQLPRPSLRLKMGPGTIFILLGPGTIFIVPIFHFFIL